MALPEMPVEVALALEDELTDTAVVYGREPTTGQWTAVLNAALPCRLGFARSRLASGAESRRELASLRELYWLADYPMPPDARVVVDGDGVIWNVLPGSVHRARQADGGLAHWTCDLSGTGRLPQATPQ